MNKLAQICCSNSLSPLLDSLRSMKISVALAIIFSLGVTLGVLYVGHMHAFTTMEMVGIGVVSITFFALLALGALYCSFVSIVQVSSNFSMSVEIRSGCKTGLIGDDNQFNYGSRLKDKYGERLFIHHSDFYLPLKSAALAEFKRRFNLNMVNEIWLPGSLFIGCKGGDIISFYLDDHLVSIECLDGESSFKDLFDFCQRESTSILFHADFNQEVPRLFGVACEGDVYRYSLDQPEKKSPVDLEELKAYNVLNFAQAHAIYHNDSIVFEIPSEVISPSSIEVLETKSARGDLVLCIVIGADSSTDPIDISNFSENDYRLSEKYPYSAYSNKIKNAYLNPTFYTAWNESAILSRHPYRQYALLSPKSSSYSIAFNEEGFLELSFSTT